ncbi:TPA: glycosyltransferase [Yersinia enterocolitica]|uniref:glycosyltransferase family 2 protein n=1 Tax=Yersinia enterocolitica TaxID=630 RepID=UPI0005E744DC|nr:glycosyltransferase [Yersinia enterocolitica]EKN3487649.1 glycosyltransferase [Yersinia enterocolitica]EKN4821934.1 glycosyltransferase [Yersinia enterocolitica]EKN4922925.1 glycosyltransferase [Yersinia enterocolitica]EKN6001426.1 glycosyltransferase [Yersinia enterocolitica]EKN6017334.1 glycosyltransferase [Yersinia enterocolitica]
MKSNAIIDSGLSDDVLLTIAIPTYKRFDLLKETLRSVFALKFNIPIEIIIVDNDPTSVKLALSEMDEFKNEKFTYYKNIENYGMFDNWNQCLNLGRGRLITILHDDDLLNSNFATELESYLSKEERVRPIEFISFGSYILEQRVTELNADGNILYILGKKIFKVLSKWKHSFKKDSDITCVNLRDIFWSNPFTGTLAIVMDREKALRLGGFDANLYPVADYDFWIRWIQNYGTLKRKNIKVAHYRILENDSLKPETASAMINSNLNLRTRMIQENQDLSVKKSDAYLIKKMEEITNHIRNRKVGHKVSSYDVANFYWLMIKYDVIKLYRLKKL